MITYKGGGTNPDDDPEEKQVDVLEEIRDLLKGNQAATAAMVQLLAGGDPRTVIPKLKADSADYGMIITDTNLLNEQGLMMSGARGIYNQIATAALPSETRAAQTLGYRNILESKAASLYSWGAALKGYSTPNRPAGEPPQDASGRRRAFSAGLDTLDENAQNTMMNPAFAQNMLDAGVITQEDFDNVRSGNMDRDTYMNLIRSQLAPGADITGMLEGGFFGDQATRLASRGGRGSAMLGGMFRLGQGMVAAGRALAGPIGMAVTAGQFAYNAADTLYSPARQAAGLGYGLSYNPFSQGYSVSLGRSITTSVDALTSFGLSRDQTVGARRAIEAMGLGGRGQEGMYNDYYNSMTEVIKETQLSPEVLAPFYEQAMRAGGGKDEIERLTQMLAVDLPDAAAASRVSLSRMAEMMQASVQAAKQSFFNVLTDTEIQQNVKNAALGGATPGTIEATMGQNNFLIARVMQEKGTGMFVSMADKTGQQEALVSAMSEYFGPDMTAEEFERRRLTDEPFAARVAAFERMTGVPVQDLQQIYETGLEDYTSSLALMSGFETDKPETLRRQKDRGLIRIVDGVPTVVPAYEEYTKETIKGTSIDLNQRGGGKKIQSHFADQLESLKRSMSESEYKEFQAELANVSGEDSLNRDTYDVIRDKASEVITEAQRPGGGDGEIDLAPDIKKWFRITFKNKTEGGESPNERFGTVGQVVASVLGQD